MATKPGTKNWDDLKMMFTAISITATLGLWNVFAVANEQDSVAKVIDQTPPTNIVEQAVTANPTAPVFTGKILLGGTAPSQTVIRVQAKAARNNQQSQSQQPVTQTRSS